MNYTYLWLQSLSHTDLVYGSSFGKFMYVPTLHEVFRLRRGRPKFRTETENMVDWSLINKLEGHGDKEVETLPRRICYK